MAGDHKGRPYGFIGALPEIWRAGEDTGHWPARR